MFDTLLSAETAKDQFRSAIIEKGLTPPDEIEADGNIHRFSSNGKPDDDAGWYVFYNGEIATGSFGDFRTGQGLKSWVADIGRALSPVEKRDFQQKQEKMRLQREALNAERRTVAKEKATSMLHYTQPASDGHPYLLHKNVKSYGLKVWKDMLLVPMIDDSGEVQSLQMISGNGDKKFLAGGKMQGCYFPLGSIRTSSPVLIAEGYATAATLHEIIGLPAIVAYNAGNLLHVARSIRAQYPNISIILCADDDIKTEGNPGVTKATEAAQAVNGKIIIPNFGDDRPDGLTDFNDMAAHLGKDAVTALFISRSLKLGFRAPIMVRPRPVGRPIYRPSM